MTTGTITRLSLSTIIKPSDANSQFNIIRYEIIISKKNTIKLKSLPPVLKMTHGGGLLPDFPDLNSLPVLRELYRV